MLHMMKKQINCQWENIRWHSENIRCFPVVAVTPLQEGIRCFFLIFADNALNFYLKLLKINEIFLK